MADMLADGMLWLSGKLSRYASTNVTYRRGSDSVVLKAKTENQLLKTFDGQGNTKLERADIDFDILASLLTFDDGVTYFTPLRGDLLEKDFGAVTAQFQVMPVGGSEPAWRYLEANRSMLRVHCKFNGNV